MNKLLLLLPVVLILSVSSSQAFAVAGTLVSQSDGTKDIFQAENSGGTIISKIDNAGNIIPSNCGIVIPNSGRTFATKVCGGNVSANRTLNYPVLNSTDTTAVLGLAQSFAHPITFTQGLTSNGNFAMGSNTITGGFTMSGSVINSGTLELTGSFVHTLTFGYTGAVDQQIFATNGVNSYIIGFGQHSSGGAPDSFYIIHNGTLAFGIDKNANAGMYSGNKFCLDFSGGSCGNNYVDLSSSNTIDLLTAGVRDIRLSSGNSVVLGSGSNETSSATDGFLYLRTNTGSLSGVPTTQTGSVAMEYEGTSNKLCFYNGAWKCAVFALSP